MPSDTRGVLKSYAVGLLVGLVLALMVTGIYLATEPQEEAGLLWGGTVYSSKEEFNGYLRSKGLSYKVWLARNPGAAPWEPAAAASKGSRATGSRGAALPSPRRLAEDGAARLPLAVIALMLATGCGLLLLVRGLRPVLARVPSGSDTALNRRAGQNGDGLGVKPPSRPSTRRLGVLAASAVQSFETSVPRYVGRLAARPRRHGRLQVPRFLRERNFGAGDVAFSLLALITGGMFVLFVVVLLTA